MLHKKKKIFTATRMIALGFLGGILLGTLLLSLPIATRERTVTPFMDAWFTATSALCVTGLTAVSTVAHWSLFGQAVILCLIQFGGLGVVTFVTTIMFILGKKLKLSDRLFIQESYNLNTLSGLVKLAKRIVLGSFFIEIIGAIFYSIQFIPEFGFLKGIWYSIFHSVSALCNAGIDLIGDNSFIPYRDNVLINITTMCLIILGSIGFPVWWDVLAVGKKVAKKEVECNQLFQKLCVHSKLVILVSIALTLGGALLTLILEYDNPTTIGELAFGNKVMTSMFQSVTTRTAGFITIPQQDFRDGTSVVYMLLMFIGGSPSGTSGGVKTVTVAIIILATISIIRDKKDTEVFGRRVSNRYLKKSIAVFVIHFNVVIIMGILLTVIQNSPFLDTMYEVISYVATVGLSRNMTSSLNVFGKMLIMLAMYFGRIGPITFGLSLNIKRYKGNKTLPDGTFYIG